MSEDRTNRRFPPYERHVFICTNARPAGDGRGDCASKGADKVLDRFKDLVHNLKLRPQIRAQKCGCLDVCERGVSVVVYPEAIWYEKVTVEDVDEIVQSHLIRGIPVKRLQMHPARPNGA